MKHLASILALALSLNVATAAEPELPEVNRKIVEFCKANMGKKVANGECAMLVVVAFEKAGAMPWDLLPAPKPPMKPNANVWGTLLGPKDAILPGDIIQFSDVELTGKNGRTLRHHTAVVAQVQGNNRFTVYEQNAAGKTEAQKKVVQLNPLDLNRKTQGEVYFYRPLKSPYPSK